MNIRNSNLAPALVFVVLAGAVSLSCQKTKPPPVTTRPEQTAANASVAAERFAKVPDAHLPNARRLTENVIVGGQPDGDAGFKDLQALGVKTIISVDGVTPNVELAHKYGFRYVHLPIGYDSVPEAQGEAIAKAIIDLPGPVYLHCHHGKHRAPAAATVACVYMGALEPADAEASLATFGTGANYKGLWQSAREARPKDPRALRNLKVDYVEQAKIPEMAEAMVEIDDHSDFLKLIQKSQWTTPGDHPDLDSAQEALMIQELLAEVDRSEAAQPKPTEFHALLKTSQGHAQTLRDTLSTNPINAAAADRAFKQLSDSCTTCHAQYRDEKPVR